MFGGHDVCFEYVLFSFYSSWVVSVFGWSDLCFRCVALVFKILFLPLPLSLVNICIGSTVWRFSFAGCSITVPFYQPRRGWADEDIRVDQDEMGREWTNTELYGYDQSVLTMFCNTKACWASSGYSAQGCVALEQSLRACMDAPVRFSIFLPSLSSIHPLLCFPPSLARLLHRSFSFDWPLSLLHFFLPPSLPPSTRLIDQSTDGYIEHTCRVWLVEIEYIC